MKILSKTISRQSFGGMGENAKGEMVTIYLHHHDLETVRPSGLEEGEESMKYVIARCKNTGTRVGLVFSERITHRDVFAGMRREFNAESAGFVYYDDTAVFGIRVTGESESLKLKSNPTDPVVLSSIMGKK